MIDRPYTLKIKNAITGTVRGMKFATLHETMFIGLQEIHEFMEKKEPGGITVYRDIFTEPLYSFTTRNGEEEYSHTSDLLIIVMKQEIEFYMEIFEKHKNIAILDAVNEILRKEKKSNLN